MTETARMMLREQLSLLSYKEAMIHRYLRILLIQASRNLSKEPRPGLHNRHFQIARQYLDLIEKGFYQYKRVSEYAQQMGLTPDHLNTIIKKVTGQSASYHIRHRIIKEAKQQAALSGSCMKTVAYELGFCDTAHFSKYFKASCGMNFSTYRKLL